MKKNKILIIEDESITAMEIQKKLQIWGYSEPVTVSSGEEALANIQDIKPDLILADIKLQGRLDGIETVKNIQETFDIPIIYITSYIDKDIIQKAKLTHPYSYLVKPLNMNELHINIQLALERQEHIETSKNVIKSTEDIYNFISSFIFPLTNNISIDKRNEYLIQFSQKLDEQYSKKFQENYFNEIKTAQDSSFQSMAYLRSLTHFFLKIGFQYEILHKKNDNYLICSKCPWNLDQSHHNFLCLICQLIMKNSMKWAQIEGEVSQKSSLPNGYENCIFEFNFQKKEISDD
ncbi:MAG: methanogen output domain 1-containing protein [Methanomicrobiales archaeon]